MTFHDPQRQDEASRIRAQLEALEIERLRLEARLRDIESEHKPSPPPSLAATVTDCSPAADQIALFRRLFAGRTLCSPHDGRIRNPAAAAMLQLAGTSGCAVFAASRRFVAVSARTIVHCCHRRGDRSPSPRRGSRPCSDARVRQQRVRRRQARATSRSMDVPVHVGRW